MRQLVRVERNASSSNDEPILIHLNSNMAARLKGLRQKNFLRALTSLNIFVLVRVLNLNT